MSGVTGFFVRIKRGGIWGNYQIDELTEEELEEFFADVGPIRTHAWAKSLAKWIRDNVKEAP